VDRLESAPMQYQPSVQFPFNSEMPIIQPRVKLHCENINRNEKFQYRSESRILNADTYVYVTYIYTDMHRLTTEIRSEKCVVRRFRRCANVIERTYTNLDSTV
jgi:hypothetical protein